MEDLKTIRNQRNLICINLKEPDTTRDNHTGKHDRPKIQRKLEHCQDNAQVDKNMNHIKSYKDKSK